MVDEKMLEEGLTDAYLIGKYDGIKQGRVEAIDEVMKECERFRNQFKSFYYSDFVRIAEQLKEENK